MLGVWHKVVGPGDLLRQLVAHRGLKIGHAMLNVLVLLRLTVASNNDVALCLGVEIGEKLVVAKVHPCFVP